MTPGPARRVAMVVNNAVHGDSRVQRIARAALDGGWQVLLVGRSPDGRQRWETIAGVETVLVPVPPVLSRGGVRPAADATARAARRRLGYRDRVAGHRGPPTRHGGWRLLDPWVQDLELALAGPLEAFAPAVIHAHDRHTIALAARSAAVLRSGGRPVRWVLDAHEYVGATAARGAGGARGALRRRMVVGLQEEFIREADAVVTVSQTLARMLRRDHRLPADPVVVLNAPVTGDTAAAGPGLRERLRLPPDVPLLVYSGGCSPPRGLATVVEALARLPRAHLALVAADDDRDVPVLLDLAARVGVPDRVHRVGYVPAGEVTALLASADVGVVPLLHRPNHEISLVTKYLEYLHAGLPVVTSDVREMARFTTEHHLGEVFPAGDAAALADAAARVLADREGYAQRVRGSEAVAATSWDRQAARLLRLYDDLLAG